VAAVLAAAGCATAGGRLEPAPFPGAPSVVRRGTEPAPAATLVTRRALALRGTPYRLGGDRPSHGLDCSGLVRYVFQQAGHALPRTVAAQFTVGSSVAPGEIAAGDLVFFDTIGDPSNLRTAEPSNPRTLEPPNPTHVGIALDADSFVHAPGAGGVVRIDRLSAPYWQPRLVGVRRVGN
jgi:cell wall-associated NlpC family hydrolase